MDRSHFSVRLSTRMFNLQKNKQISVKFRITTCTEIRWEKICLFSIGLK
jgi:hypothetical protein